MKLPGSFSRQEITTATIQTKHNDSNNTNDNSSKYTSTHIVLRTYAGMVAAQAEAAKPPRDSNKATSHHILSIHTCASIAEAPRRDSFHYKKGTSPRPQ
jgi:hypothetical protein